MQNKQLSDVKGKELVAAGHAFAKAIGMDTPLIEIAKMVSELAGRLDCALVRGDELEAQRDALAAENALLKSNLMFWDAEDPEMPYDNPEDIANNCAMEVNTEFDVQVAAKMPNRTYRVSEVDDYDCTLELVSGEMPLTPATDAYLSSVRADAVQELADAWFAIANETSDGVSISDSTRLKYRQRADDAADFAKQLRAGEPS